MAPRRLMVWPMAADRSADPICRSGILLKADAILARAASSGDPVRAISRLKVPKRSVFKPVATSSLRPRN
eukprot:gene44220-biopygen30308